MDPLLIDIRPELLRNELQEILLCCERNRGLGKPQPCGDAKDMGIHGYAFAVMECLVQDDIGGLSADAGKLRQFPHGPWHFASMLGHDDLGCFDRVLCLGAPEAYGADDLADFCWICLCQGESVGPAAEEFGRHTVHAGIGRLCREHDCDEERIGAVVVKGALGSAILLLHAAAYLDGTLLLRC